MPKVLEDRVKKIKAGNPDMEDSEAYGIATKQLQKSGEMKKKGRGVPKDMGSNDPKSLMPRGLFGRKKK